MSAADKEENKNLLQSIVGFLGNYFSFVKEWLTDEDARKAMLTDLGLPADSPPKLDIPQDSLDSIDRYRKSKDPNEEAIAEAVQDISIIITAVKAFVRSAGVSGEAAIEEYTHRFFELMTLSYLRLHLPALYWLGVALAFIEESLTTHSPGKTYLDRVVALFKGIGAHFDKYVWHDLNTEEQARASSDLYLLASAIALVFLGKKLHISDFYYGWDVLGEPSLPDQISDRTLSFLIPISEDDPPNAFMTGTVMLVPRVHGGPGILIAFGGSGTVEEDLNDNFQFKFTLSAANAIDFLFKLDPFEFDTNAAADAGASFSIEALNKDAKQDPYVIGISERSRLEFNKLSLTGKISGTGADLKLTADNSALVIAATKDADSFVSKAMSTKETRVAFKFGIGVSSEAGLYLEGGAGLRSIVPIGKSLGPVHIQSLQLGLVPNSDQGASTLAVDAGATIDVKLGPVKASIDQIGFRMLLDFAKEDANLGFADLSFGFQPPKGVGLAIDATAVSGGGFLFFDPENDQYAGVVQLQLEIDTGDLLPFTFDLKAIGILSSSPPGSSIPFSLIMVISAEKFDPPYTFGPGIKWTGIGGLIGLNRTANVEALRAGIKNHALDAILFPENPIAEAPRLIASLGTLFPRAADQFVVGLMAKFEWPTPTLLTADLGFIVEFPRPVRLIAVGQFRARLPRPDVAQVKINVDAVGIYDFQRNELSIDATLFESSILSYALTGDGILRMGGDETVLSLGGFHPHYKPPPGLPRLDRLAVNFSEGSALRLRAEAYLAITSNSLQFGAKIEAYIGFGGFSVEGHVGLDALFQSEYPEFVALVQCGIALKYHGFTLLGADLDMTVSGYKPLHLEGKVKFEIFGFDKSKSFNKTFFKDEAPANLPSVDPMPEILLALRDGRNWSAQLPKNVSTLVTVRTRSVPNVVVIHPLGEIAVRQRVAPLNLELTRFGQSRLSGDRRFALTDLALNGQPVEPDPIHDKFAAGQFLDLTDTQRLSRPSLESLEAGVRISPTEIRFGGQGAGEAGFMTVSELEYETCILGEHGECLTQETPHKPSLGLVLSAAQLGPAAHAAAHTSGISKYKTSSPSVRVHAPSYAVANKENLQQTDGDGGPGPQTVQYASYTAAEQALRRQSQPGPSATDGLQVVWKFELAKENS